MSNLSKIRRDKMIEFLETLKEQHSDDESLIAINQIEKELVSKRYGLVWEEHEEAVDVMMRDNIPVFTEVKEREICMAPGQDYDFLLEGDNLHSLYLLEKTHRGKVDVIYAPTDNMIAAGMATVAMIANENKIPIICGEEGMVKEGGLATYGINYYELGYKTGEMAAKILTEGADPASMPIEYLSTEECSLLINKETADTLGIDVSSYDADSLYTAE